MSKFEQKVSKTCFFVFYKNTKINQSRHTTTRASSQVKKHHFLTFFEQAQKHNHTANQISKPKKHPKKVYFLTPFDVFLHSGRVFLTQNWGVLTPSPNPGCPPNQITKTQNYMKFHVIFYEKKCQNLTKIIKN